MRCGVLINGGSKPARFVMTPLLPLIPSKRVALSPAQRARQKPLPLYCDPLGHEVQLLPPTRNTWFAFAGNAKSERAPAQTKAISKRIGLIGRRPKKLIPRNRLQDSQFQGTKLLRMILRERRGSHSEWSEMHWHDSA